MDDLVDDDTAELQIALNEATSKEQRRRLQNRIAQRNHRKRVRQAQREQAAQDSSQQDSNGQSSTSAPEPTSTTATAPLDTSTIPNPPSPPFPPPLPPSMDDPLLTNRNSRSLSTTSNAFCASCCGPIDSMIDPLLLDVSVPPATRTTGSGVGVPSDWQVVGSPLNFDDGLPEPPSFLSLGPSMGGGGPHFKSNGNGGGHQPHQHTLPESSTNFITPSATLKQSSDGLSCCSNSNNTGGHRCSIDNGQAQSQCHQCPHNPHFSHSRSHQPFFHQDFHQGCGCAAHSHSNSCSVSSPSHSRRLSYQSCQHPQCQQQYNPFLSRQHSHPHQLPTPMATPSLSSVSHSNSNSNSASNSSPNSNSSTTSSNSPPHQNHNPSPNQQQPPPATTPAPKNHPPTQPASAPPTSQIPPPTNKASPPSALHIALSSNHPAILSMLLSQGHSPNERDTSGIPLLHKAAISGREDMVRILLEAHADQEVLDPDGWTALQRAAEQGNEDVVGVLLGVK